MNRTTWDTVDFPVNYPFYHIHSESIFPFISDKNLSLLAPVVVYWIESILFELLDRTSFPWLEKYRIHESAEVQSRNKCSKMQVIVTVFLQQIIQTIVGAYWLDDDEIRVVDHVTEMRRLAPYVQQAAIVVLGKGNALNILRDHGTALISWVYWWGLPVLQCVWAILIVDTWQYALHRLMHNVPFLYRNFHSWHHRLYVPYAFGALYNHPLEGFALDILGTAMAHSLSFMTTRQAVLLFTFTTAKTVDDHCGWRLPWDPMQILFSNNADYHDIHHQAIGIKKNFSQPYFIHWDVILGTRMTRKDIQARRGVSESKSKIS
ncbi:sphingosine hydroxylase [Sistotremastrum suecicum HHB10207 ss-3]|uniref:Sphingosine hydroxylase n=1 Tax=Sistotremastrum suecicum HHB10207 ss-3 TaxID=1314776 RepID=A0A166B094_9AGAM|nr:sphingosine hydroxylase [Sistotremastrum suecicum HHB10207 ss-3]